MPAQLTNGFAASHNATLDAALTADYDALGATLDRRGIAIDAVRETLAGFSLAVPSWGLGRGGTRFAKFSIPGEPVSIHEKLEDAGIVQALGAMTPRVSPHFPWDRVDDYAGLREEAATLGLSFDAVNSNTFQDQPGQTASYRHGSLSSTDPAARDLAVAHNIECIEAGIALGSDALTIWVGDGSNLPGQAHLGRALERYIDAVRSIYDATPDDWRLLLEHKMFEPAFYSTVIADWGSSLLAAQALGPKAQCLIDLGHHAPNVNIEQIVARLNFAGKLGGFHFNDSKYGDDDLDSGAIDPHQLFLVFNELAEAELAAPERFNPAYMIDQSHNVTDPIESLLSSTEAIAIARAKALLVDRDALRAAQDGNDAMGAFRILRDAYETDVRPLVARVRRDAGGAIDVIGAYRASGWREARALQRRPAGQAAGIV